MSINPQYLKAMRFGEQDVLQKQRRDSMDIFLAAIEAFGKKAIRAQEQQGYKNNPTTVAPVGPYMHGPGGLFSTPGMSPAMFSAMVQPLPGMITALPVNDAGLSFSAMPKGYEGYGGFDAPFITSVTGITDGDDDWSDQPDNTCDDPPTGGNLKTCIQSYTFGRFSKQLPQIDATRVGRLNNWGEYGAYQLENPRNPIDNPLQPEETLYRAGNWINNELATRMVTAGVGFQRMLAPLVYSGTPANNTAGGGSRQFLGFNGIYTTGRVDVLSQVACPAMDSYLVNFGADVNDTNLQGLYLYQVLESTHYHQDQLAIDSGLGPVGWQISMDRNLFRLLTQIIPIQQYVRVISTMNTINGTDTGGRLNISGEQASALRNDMFEGRWLPLNGVRIPVTLEDPTVIGTTYTAATNTSVGKVFLHPMTVLGGIPVTYWQFFRFTNRQYAELADFAKGVLWTSDSGKFAWTFDHKNWCLTFKWLTEPRVISHTPQLGAVISNISFTPEAYVRSAYPANSSFYQNGGNIYRDPIEGYPSWSTGTETTIPYPISN